MLLARIELALMALSQKVSVAYYSFVRLPMLLACVRLALTALSQKALKVKKVV